LSLPKVLENYIHKVLAEQAQTAGQRHKQQAQDLAEQNHNDTALPGNSSARLANPGSFLICLTFVFILNILFFNIFVQWF